MGFKQARYKLIDDKIVKNIFDSELPMDGWALDAEQARKAIASQAEEKVKAFEESKPTIKKTRKKAVAQNLVIPGETNGDSS